MNQDFVGARTLYEHVTTIEPHNAYAHAALGLLILGSGSSNYGAVDACGSDEAELAVKHLQLATRLDGNMKV